MSLPKPQVGMVIRYSFLWSHQAIASQKEGSKDRPCAIAITVSLKNGETAVRVLPITHTPPADLDGAVEIPLPTKQFLKLDSDRSWVILDELNDFIWPGFDLRPKVPGDMSTVSYGMLPKAFMKAVLVKLSKRYGEGKSKKVRRNE